MLLAPALILPLVTLHTTIAHPIPSISQVIQNVLDRQILLAPRPMRPGRTPVHRLHIVDDVPPLLTLDEEWNNEVVEEILVDEESIYASLLEGAVPTATALAVASESNVGQEDIDSMIAKLQHQNVPRPTRVALKASHGNLGHSKTPPSSTFKKRTGNATIFGAPTGPYTNLCNSVTNFSSRIIQVSPQLFAKHRTSANSSTDLSTPPVGLCNKHISLSYKGKSVTLPVQGTVSRKPGRALREWDVAVSENVWRELVGDREVAKEDAVAEVKWHFVQG